MRLLHSGGIGGRGAGRRARACSLTLPWICRRRRPRAGPAACAVAVAPRGGPARAWQRISCNRKPTRREPKSNRDHAGCQRPSETTQERRSANRARRHLRRSRRGSAGTAPLISVFLPGAASISAGETGRCAAIVVACRLSCALIAALAGTFAAPVLRSRGMVRAARGGGPPSRRPQHDPEAVARRRQCQRTGKRPKVLSALALATVLYTVKSGDTLSGIAQHYNTTWEAVYDGNHSAIQNPNVVYAGQQLRVREGDLATGLVPVQAAAPQSSSDQGAPVKSYTVTPAAATSAPAQSAAGSA